MNSNSVQSKSNLENFIMSTGADVLDDAALSTVVGGAGLDKLSYTYTINLLGPSIDIDLTLSSVDLSDTSH